MASLSGLQSGFFTDIDVVDSIAINGDVGTANQVLTSDGTKTSYEDPTLPAVSSLLNAGTGITITSTGNPETIATDIDADTIVFDGNSMEVAKVPNALTAGTNISFNTGTTYDGSGAITISATDTNTQLTLTEGSGIDITDLGGTNRRIAANIDADTIVFSSNEITCAKVPNVLTAGTNISFTDTSDGAAATTYDGSSGITVSATDTNTQLNLTEGNGITITNTGGVNRTIAVNADGTTLSNNVGSGQAGVIKVPQDLTAGHNIVLTGGYNGGTARTITSSPYFVHSVYDPSSTDFDSLSTSYSSLLLTNVRADITAEETTLCIELITYNYTISSNRSFYLRLVDNGGTEFSTGSNQGGYGTGTRNTERITQVADETDKQEVRQTWFIQGLTIGNTYTFQPQAKTSSTTNYIAAGGTYPATILRGYYLPASGG